MKRILNGILQGVNWWINLALLFVARLGFRKLYLFLLKIIDVIYLFASGFPSTLLVKAMLHKKTKNNQIKVFFIVHRIAIFPSFESIIREMMADTRFNPRVLIMSDVGLLENTDLSAMEKLLEAKQIPFQHAISPVTGMCLDLIAENPDYVFLQTPYYYATPAQPFFSNFIWLFSEVLWTNYGYAIDNNYCIPFWNKHYQVIHRAKFNFVESEKHAELYAQLSDLGRLNVVPIGYSKFDCYRNTPGNFGNYWKQNDPNTHRILWATHYTVPESKDRYKASSFLEIFAYMLDLVRNESRIQVVLKPHPYLFPTLLSENIVSAEILETMKRDWCECKNATIYEGGDYFPLFQTSDAILNESLSFTAEYLPTKKPMLILVSKNRSPFGEIGEVLVKHMYQAHSTEEIGRFIHDVVIHGNDSMFAERSRIADIYTPLDCKVSVARKICDFLLAQG